jgi:hypothetical protein
VGGVWAVGAGARATAGLLPCAAGAVGGFGRVWQAEAWARDRLGCPLAPEAGVRIRTGVVVGGANVRSGDAPGHGYWPENDWPDWFELAGTGWTARAKAERPWAVTSAQALDGAAQRFAGGTMLWLPHPDGRRVILVLAEPDQQWREWSD